MKNTPINIAINGFGRIGRCVVRALLECEREDIKIVAINSRADAKTAAHLLRYDSTHGTMRQEITARDDAIDVGGLEIPYRRESDIANMSWDNVDVVLECVGRFNGAEQASAHIKAGAKKVLISAPAKDADLTVVYGVNHHKLKADMTIVSNASCTTNCLAPVAKTLHELAGIESGFMNTIHSYTTDQRLLDNSHGDLRRARAAAASIVPTKTGAAAAIGLVLPELVGKLSGVAMRVPTMNVSLVDLSCTLSREVSAAEIKDAMQQAAAGELAGVLSVNELPLVSVDFNGRAESSIFDSTQTATMGNLVKIFAWYDNEWGFSNRMLDTAAAMMEAT